MPDSVLPNFDPSALVISWRGERVRSLALHAVDQVEPSGQVAPLVAAARLQHAAVAAEQLEEVQPLQDLVAELGVGDAGVAVEPGADSLLGDHPVDPEVLADVAQQVDGGQRRGPVQVVDHDGCVVALEGQVGLDLGADPVDPLAHRLLGVESAFRFRLGVADQAGGTTDQGERPVPGELQTPQREDLHEVADVEAGCRRVEAAVVGDRARVEGLAHGVEVGAHGDQAAPLQVVEELGCRDHDDSLPDARRRRRTAAR